jgi:exopolysaccharide biosynthesis protein
MKHPKQLRNFCIWLSIVCVLCGQAAAQNWRTIADGVEHAQVRRELSGKPVNFNLLRLDLRKVRLDVHHAMDMAIGTETTSSIAKRHGALAAINAGFFRMDTSLWAGDADGVLMIDGRLWSESRDDRVAIMINNEIDRTHIQFGHVNALGSIGYFTDVEQNLSGINRERKAGELILYTPDFGRTTQTTLGGTEIIVRECTQRYCRKFDVAENSGNCSIPANGFVLSISSDATRDQQFLIDHMKSPAASMKYIAYETQLKRGGPASTLLVRAEDITNGVPQLIKNGKIDITWEQEKASKSFVETRHPRTAVAKLNDGRFLMLTADGRTDESAGLDLYDLAKYMLELGAVDAMNFDGGGSTTMFVDGKVVNKPSDKEGERKVSDAILVTLRKKLQKPAR